MMHLNAYAYADVCYLLHGCDIELCSAAVVGFTWFVNGYECFNGHECCNASFSNELLCVA